MLRLASMYSASASLRNRCSRSATFVGPRTTSDDSKSNARSRSRSVVSAADALSEGMLIGRREEFEGEMVE